MTRARTSRPWRRMSSRAAVACALLLAVIGSSPAFADTTSTVIVRGRDPQCQTPPQAASPIREVPWAQRWFAPDRVWPITAGDGVIVAVVDTGVDATHPQLSEGAVRRGVDVLGEMPGGNVDCDAHGTAVASLVAASNQRGIGLTGLAPDAEILPIRVADRHAERAEADEGAQVDPVTFARGLREAVRRDAKVVNVSIVFNRHHGVIHEAVQEALDQGVVIVAAVGNRPADVEPGRAPTPYPAAYDGVIGVGAIREDGGLDPTSGVGEFVDLVAPGADVTAAYAGGGHQRWTGTSFAAPFVSASAALLLAAEGDMDASEVANRLYATADRAGPRNQYGHGIVNPYRALTERVGGGGPVAAEPLPAIVTDARAQARAARWRRRGRLATTITLTTISLGAVAILAIPLVAHGRRRRWSPTRWAGPPADPPAVDEPEDVFFSVPGPHDHSVMTADEH